MKSMSTAKMRAMIAELQQQVMTLKRKPVLKRGKNGDPNRGAWCTAKSIAKAVGPWDLDAFSNPRSHVVSRYSCMLERGENGLLDEKRPGSFYCLETAGRTIATEDTRFWGQPPYDLVMRAIKHYQHTRFCFLLRFDPRTAWFRRIYPLCEQVCVLRKCNFEPPPGVKASSSTFPHALFYRRAADVTEEVVRLSISWRKQVHG